MNKYLNKILEENLVNVINEAAIAVGSEMANNLEYIKERKNNPETKTVNDWIGGALGLGWTSEINAESEYSIVYFKPEGDLGWFKLVKTEEVSELKNVAEVFGIVSQES